MDKWEQEREEQKDYESYMSAMQRRLNLQMLGSYIRDGSCKQFISCDSFRDRENRAYSRLEKWLTERYGDAADEIMEEMFICTSVVEEIYFNLGMKSGVTLYSKLTGNFETDI